MQGGVVLKCPCCFVLFLLTTGWEGQERQIEAMSEGGTRNPRTARRNCEIYSWPLNHLFNMPGACNFSLWVPHSCKFWMHPCCTWIKRLNYLLSMSAGFAKACSLTIWFRSVGAGMRQKAAELWHSRSRAADPLPYTNGSGPSSGTIIPQWVLMIPFLNFAESIQHF